MLHRDALNYINRVFKDLALTEERRALPFGGKTILLGGDWKQLTTVIPGSNSIEQIQASIKSDPLFRHFETLRLPFLLFPYYILLFTASLSTCAQTQIRLR